MAGIFFWLPLETAVFFMKYVFNVEAQQYVDIVLGGIEKFDQAVRPFTGGYSLMHYSPSIIDACYECRSLAPLPDSPLPPIVEMGTIMKNDLYKIPHDLKNALFQISYGFNRISPALNDSFELLGHQLKASFEQIGNSFPNSMATLDGQFKDAGHDIQKQFEWNYKDLKWKDKDFTAVVNVPYYYGSIRPASR
jgi:hypothetical protein